LEKGGIFLAK